MTARKIRFRFSLLLICLSSVALALDAEQVPPLAQGTILLKVLSFNRNLKRSSQSSVKIGILYMPGEPQSIKSKDLLLDVFQNPLANTTVQGLPIKVMAIPYEKNSDLNRLLKGSDINVIYLCPNFGPLALSILENCRSSGILTLTGVQLYVAAGACVGVVLNENKPEILINLKVCQASGANFDVRLLKLATVVK